MVTHRYQLKIPLSVKLVSPYTGVRCGITCFINLSVDRICSVVRLSVEFLVFLCFFFSLSRFIVFILCFFGMAVLLVLDVHIFFISPASFRASYPVCNFFHTTASRFLPSFFLVSFLRYIFLNVFHLPLYYVPSSSQPSNAKNGGKIMCTSMRNT